MPDRPNLVVFFTDQQRHDTTGVHGCPLGLTPNFDRLARAGTDVHHSFTCQPVCGPARACLQTGAYATTHGSVVNGIGLNRDLPNLAGCFNDAGYHTGYIGKWHLAHHDDGDQRQAVRPEDRGNYQSWLAAQALEFSVNEYHTVLYDRDENPVRLPGYRSDAVADAMIRHIDDRAQHHAGQPFFLMGSFIEPHHQNDVDDYPAPEGYRERYAGRWIPPDLAALPTHPSSSATNQATVGGTTHQHLGGYFGMVKRLDEGLGRVCDALRSLGILENTIILFTSDHGCHFKTRNAEYKRSGHEASIRVPTMLHGGPFQGGGRLGQLVSLIDLPPTLLDACGIAIPETMQGRSVLSLVRREAGARVDWPEEVLVQVSESCVGRAVRTARWKYIVQNDDTPGHAGSAEAYHEALLYDLKHDPHELTNLITMASHGEVRRAMRQRLVRRMREAGEAEPTIVKAQPTASGQRAVPETEVWG